MTVDRGRAPTLHDVARRAGVSVSTASRALANKPHVSALRSERVADAVEVLGYRPNAMARSLRTSRSMTIGFVAHALTSPLLLTVLNGLTEALEQVGYTLLVTNARGSAESYRRLLPRLFDRQVDALFLANPDFVRDELALYRAAHIPTLGLLSRGAGCSDVPLLDVTSGAAAFEAGARFAELGHRRAVLALSPHALRNEFVRSLAMALHASGIETVVCELAGDPERGISDLLEDRAQRSGPTLAFVTSPVALSLLTACERRGIDVPGDLSICAVTDHESLTLLRTPIAALASETYELGRRAAQMMFAWLDGDEPQNVTSLDLTRWIERASVGPAPTR